MPATHPSLETLQAFGFGKLDDATAEEVLRHLERCPDCRQQVAELSGDSFLDKLRAAHGRGGTAVPGKSLSGVARSLQPRRTAASLPPSTPDLPPELLNHPQYEVGRELGRGGMGVVYLARNVLLDRPEVLKVVSKALLDRPGAEERFLREMRSAARLSHDNVVKAYSAVSLGELLVFAMEYVEGQDLARVVKQQGQLSVPHACFYAHQAALGLQHAHEHGMIHRDIKPHNLILSRQGKKHFVKVLDFGLAKATREGNADTELTGAGMMMGTPDYIAPEQAEDAARADIRADIYSLGCTLYFLLTGSPPFKGKSLLEVLQAHLSLEAKPLDQVRAEVPAALAAVVAKMMAKDPARRYQTPKEVAEALAPFVRAAAKAVPAGGASQGPQAAKRVAPSPSAGRQETLLEGSSTVARVQSKGTTGRRRSAAAQSVAKKWWAIVAVAAACLLLAGLVGLWAAGVFVKTKDGTILLENLPADAEVTVDGAKVTVTWGEGGKRAEITVKPGTRSIVARSGGLQVIGSEVKVADGGREVLTAKLVPNAAPPADGRGKQEAGNGGGKLPAASKAPPSDYDDLAKSHWIALLSSEEEFNLLQTQKAFRGRKAVFDHGLLECFGGVKFPAPKAKDAIIRYRLKTLGVKGRMINSLTLRYNDNSNYVGAFFNGPLFGIGRAVSGTWKDLTTCTLSESYDGFFEFAFAAVGDKLTVYVNGRKILQASESVFAESRGFPSIGGDGLFRDIEIQVLDAPTSP